MVVTVRVDVWLALGVTLTLDGDWDAVGPEGETWPLKLTLPENPFVLVMVMIAVPEFP